MSELIDRQAALDVLCDACGNCACPKGKIPRCSYYEKMQAIPTASPWRRVEDELPESGTHVLACCEVRGIYGHKSHYVCDAFHTDNKSIPCSYNDDIDSEYDEETDEYYFPVGWWEVIKNWDDYSCVAIHDFVTHWMPLPEPPKEDA